MPPTGATKAAATPAAAPMPTQFRCFAGSRISMTPDMPNDLLNCCERKRPTPAPMLTIGPSRPIGKPLATMRMMPITLTTTVCQLRMSSTCTPLRKACAARMGRGGGVCQRGWRARVRGTLSCGRPEPAAVGAQKTVMAAAVIMSMSWSPRKVKYDAASMLAVAGSSLKCLPKHGGRWETAAAGGRWSARSAGRAHMSDSVAVRTPSCSKTSAATMITATRPHETAIARMRTPVAASTRFRASLLLFVTRMSRCTCTALGGSPGSPATLRRRHRAPCCPRRRAGTTRRHCTRRSRSSSRPSPRLAAPRHAPSEASGFTRARTRRNAPAAARRSSGWDPSGSAAV